MARIFRTSVVGNCIWSEREGRIMVEYVDRSGMVARDFKGRKWRLRMTASFRGTLQVHLGRSHLVLGMGGLEHVGRFLFLLRLPVDHRFRRHRAGRQNLRSPGPRSILHLLLHVPDARWVATDPARFYRFWRLMFPIFPRNPFLSAKISFRTADLFLQFLR